MAVRFSDEQCHVVKFKDGDDEVSLVEFRKINGLKLSFKVG